MSKSISLRSAIISTLAAALLAVGLSVVVPAIGKPGGHPGGHHGPPMGLDVTYSEVHRYVNGSEVVTRADQGKLAAVTADSLTLTRLDGSQVTVSYDSATRLRAPKTITSIASIPVDSNVVTIREGDGAAKAVVLPRPQVKPGKSQGKQGSAQHR